MSEIYMPAVLEQDDPDLGPDEIPDDFLRIATHLDTYTEYFPSRKALHCIVIASVPASLTNPVMGLENERHTIQLITTGFVTITGCLIDRFPRIVGHRQTAVDAVIKGDYGSAEAERRGDGADHRRPRLDIHWWKPATEKSWTLVLPASTAMNSRRRS